MTTKKRLGRLAAGASALALVGAGLLGTAASAVTADPSIDGDATGSVTVHKYDGTPSETRGDGTATDTSGFGNALAGVEFTLTPINLTNPLTTSEGWTEVEALNAALPTAPGNLGTPVTGTTGGSGEAVFGGLAVGAYYVQETGSGSNLITEPVVPFIVTIPYPNDGGWLYDVHVYPKNQVTTTTPSKTAEAPTGTAQTGDKIDWTITVAVPRVTNGYSAFVIDDSLGEGLELDAVAGFTVGGADLVAGDYEVDGGTITLTASGLSKLNGEFTEGVESVPLTLTLTTTVTGQGTFTNNVTITINGVELPPATADTNWGGIIVTKTSGEGDDAATLQGAEFELYDGKGGTLIGEAKATGADGTLTFIVWVGNDDVTTRDGLFLKETVAPAGHVLPSDPWFEVGTVTADANTSVEISIANYKPEGPDLPLTGAQGTLLFMVIGVGLIGAGAAAVGIRRARANH